MISATDSVGFLEVSRVHVSDADKERFRNEMRAINQSCSSVRALSVRLNEAMLASILANSPGTLVPLTVLFAPIVVVLVLAALFFTRVKTAWSDVGEGLGARTFSVVDSN